MTESLDKWYGWIPTNRGKINFSFISDKNLITLSPKKSFNFIKTANNIEIKKLDISVTSDSSNFSAYKKPNSENEDIVELMTYSDIELSKNEETISGKINVYNEEMEFKSDFIIDLNGKIYFSTDNHFFINNKKKKLIKILMYIIIKTIVHGDSHHHQKIDIALPITEDNFNKSQIVETFLDYIKLVERNVKVLNNCESRLRSETAVEEIKGYISYLKTFNQLFKDESCNFDKELKIAENLHESLKATVDKRKTKNTYKSTIITTLITFMGIFISLNILFNGFWEQNTSDIVYFFKESSRYEYLKVLFIVTLLCFILNILCISRSIVYFKFYDYFEIIRQIKNSSFEKLNFRGRIIKLLPLILILLACSIYFRMEIYELLKFLIDNFLKIIKNIIH